MYHLYQNEQIWWNVSGAHTRMNETPEYYYTLYTHFDDYPLDFINAIELDLRRTFPGQDLILKSGILQRMKNILTAYSKRNNFVGYCQGMNFLAGHLVSFCREVEAFWILVLLLENIMPVDYYTTMYTVLADQQIFHNLLRVKAPRIARHLDAINLEPSLFALQWFMCIYTKTAHKDILNVIWDYLFIEGDIVLFKAGLILIKFIEKDLLKAKDMAAALDTIEKKIILVSDAKKFKNELNKLYLSHWTISKLREIYRNKVKDDIKKNEEETKKKQITIKKYFDEKIPECKVSWPTCALTLKNKSKLKKSSSFFIFQSDLDPPPIINDFFSSASLVHQTIISNTSKILDQPYKNTISHISLPNSSDPIAVDYTYIKDRNMNILISRDPHKESCPSKKEELLKAQQEAKLLEKKEDILYLNVKYDDLFPDTAKERSMSLQNTYKIGSNELDLLAIEKMKRSSVDEQKNGNYQQILKIAENKAKEQFAEEFNRKFENQLFEQDMDERFERRGTSRASFFVDEPHSRQKLSYDELPINLLIHEQRDHRASILFDEEQKGDINIEEIDENTDLLEKTFAIEKNSFKRCSTEGEEKISGLESIKFHIGIAEKFLGPNCY